MAKTRGQEELAWLGLSHSRHQSSSPLPHLRRKGERGKGQYAIDSDSNSSFLLLVCLLFYSFLGARRAL